MFNGGLFVLCRLTPVAGIIFVLSLQADANDTMYILKIKGTARIPDYVQLRDSGFTLIAYFRVDRPERALSKCGLTSKLNEILKIINEIPFGKMMKLDV